MAIREKHERYAALDKAEGETLEALKAEFPERDAEVKEGVRNRPRRSTCASWC